MKMLGQDVHTQEEFDSFKAKEFDPVVDQIKSLKKKVICLFLFQVILATTDILTHVL